MLSNSEINTNKLALRDVTAETNKGRSTQRILNRTSWEKSIKPNMAVACTHPAPTSNSCRDML